MGSASDGPQNSLAANWNDDEYNLNPLKDRDNYTYYFNVCEALVNTENNVEKVTVPTPTQTSVLQVTLNGKRGPHVIGTSSDSSLTSLHGERCGHVCVCVCVCVYVCMYECFGVCVCVCACPCSSTL